MNIINIILGENDEFLRRRETVSKPLDDPLTITHITPEKFRPDIEALADYVGETNLKQGLRIEVSLSELLTILPRKRRRTDAYATLIKYLKDERGIILTIKPNKYD